MKSEKIEELVALFRDIDDEVEDMSSIVKSMKRDEQFLQAASGTWASSIGMNRSVQPNDKADPS